MKKYASVAAAFLLSSPLVLAQGLPPTNMGKWVHQPGDNQYNTSTQQERHGTSYADRTGPGASVYYGKGGGGGGGGSAAIAPSGPKSINPMILMGGNRPKVDISIEPISSDEPVPPPGFPPLPERLQLPVATGPSGSGSNWRSNGGGGGRGGGGGGGGGGSSPVEGVHQHYVHLKPGAFQNKGGGGGGDDSGPPPDESAVPGLQGSSIGGAGASPQVQNQGGGVGYYKARTAPPPIVHRPGGPSEISTGGSIGGDNFNSGGPGAPRYRGTSSGDLKKLGRAPGLDPKQDAATAPEAPQAAVVTQSTTQDLSLPDDEFVSRYGLQDTAGKRFGRAVGRTAGQVGKRVINRTMNIVPF